MPSASSAPDPAVLARAFLALGDGDPVTPPRAMRRAALVLLIALALAFSAPLLRAGLAADAPDTAAIAPHRTVLVDADPDEPGGP
jgi:hypothetical protein